MSYKRTPLRTFLTATVLASALTAPNAFANDYPQQNIRLVIPWGPGGPTDILGRLISQQAERHLGQTIVPVNMAGASASIGSRHVKEARADGYTLLNGQDDIVLAKIAGVTNFSYDAFEPVALLTQTPNIPTAHADHPVQSATEIVDYVRENAGQVRFGMVFGASGHFFWLQFFEAAGIDVDEVRLVGYSDTGEIISAVLAKEVDFAMFNLPSAASFYEEGAFTPLGVAHSERLKELSDVPTLHEQGIDLEHATSRGILAPKGTSQDVVDILAEAYGQALENDQVRSRIENELGSIINYLPSDAYREFLEEDEASLSAAAERAGI